MNYGDLKQYVSDFTHRQDLSAQMNTFFDLAHRDIIAAIDWQSFERAVDIDGSAAVLVAGNVYSFPLPLDALRLRSVTSLGRDISYLPPSILRTRFRSSGGDQSSNYSVVGRAIWTAPGSSDISIIYQAAEPPMVADSDENEIARVYPNLYIFGATSQLQAFVQDDDEEAKARNRFNAELSIANEIAERLRYGVAPSVQGV